MIKCNKCGAELNEHSRFCGKCGMRVTDLPSEHSTGAVSTNAVRTTDAETEQYCVRCGARLPSGCVFCLICGTKTGETPPPEPVPAYTGYTVEIAAVPASQRHSRRLVAVCVFLCILLVISSVSVWFFQNIPYFGAVRKTYAKSAVLYVTDGNTLKFKAPLMKEPETLVSGYSTDVGISGSRIAQSSPDGGYIAYINGYAAADGKYSGQLYLRDLSQKPGLDNSPVSDKLLAENVVDGFFFSSDSGFIVYLTADDRLCITDYTESSVIDSGVSEILDHDGAQLLYVKGLKTGGNTSVFLYPISGGGKTLVDDNILLLSDYTPAFDKFVYLRENADGSRDAVAYDARRNNRQVLASGVGDLLSSDARTFSAMYQTNVPNAVRYEDIIDDSFARADERIHEPDMDAYPLLKEFYEKYGVDADYQGSMDYEEIVEESAQLEADLDNYVAKRDRDKLRKQILDELDSFLTAHPALYELRVVHGGQDIKLASGSFLPYSDAVLDTDKGVAMWSSATLKGYKKIHLSKYAESVGAASLQSHFESHISQNVYFQQLGSNSIPLYIGEGSFYSGGFRLCEKVDGIYLAMGTGSPFSNHADNSCSLYYAPIQNNSVGNIVLVDEHIDSVGPMLTGNRLLYFKERHGDTADLFLAAGMAGQRIGDNVSLISGQLQVLNGNSTLIYSEHFDSSLETGSCFMYSKQNRQLSTDVHRAFYRNDSLVYLLKGFRAGKAELYSFGNDGLVRIDDNVTSVFE